MLATITTTMYEIKDSEGEFGVIDTLLDKILNTCQKNENRAYAFALIVFDFYDPHINKILNDEDYFNALDYATGKELTVFFINSDYLRVQSEKAKETSKMRIELSIEKVKGATNYSPKYIAEKLLNEESLPSPSVLFFNVNNNTICDSTIARLRENEIEKGLNELIQLMKTAVKSFENVQEKNRGNQAEIFQLLKQTIDSSEYWQNTKSRFDKLMKIKDFLFFWKV